MYTLLIPEPSTCRTIRTINYTRVDLDENQFQYVLRILGIINDPQVPITHGKLTSLQIDGIIVINSDHMKPLQSFKKGHSGAQSSNLYSKDVMKDTRKSLFGDIVGAPPVWR